LLIQQNLHAYNFFNRSWAEFKVGFNDTRGNFWLGNDLLSQLTLTGRYKLKFDLQSRVNSSWYYAQYSTFLVSNETANYRLHVAGYSGNAGYDAFSYHDSRMFTTYDRDNDQCCTAADSGTMPVSTAASTLYGASQLATAGSVYLEEMSCSHLECGCSVSMLTISVDTTDSAQPLNLVLRRDIYPDINFLAIVSKYICLFYPTMRILCLS